MLLLVLTSACSITHDDELVGSRTRPVVCSPRQDITIAENDDYVGAHEEVGSTDTVPEGVGHASAIEIAKAQSASNTVFATAWISQRYNAVMASVYDVGANQVTHTTMLPYGAHSRRWVARLGHDDVCTAVQGASSCAWFVWNDSYGETTWTAVGPAGSTGYVRWLAGLDGSGDVGVYDYPGVGTLRRKLLAYITLDRKQVKAVALDEDGSPIGSTLTLRTTQTNFKAYQTAVVWSAQAQRWLVVWAENYMPADHYWKGKIQSRWVDRYGLVMQSTSPNVTYCEGNPTTSVCRGGAGRAGEGENEMLDDGGAPSISSSLSIRPEPIAKPDAGPDAGGGTRMNDNCICKGFYVAAQDLPWFDDDRFRIHHYNVHVRMGTDGSRVAMCNSTLGNALSPDCNTMCPLASSVVSTPQGLATFQLIGNATLNSEQRRLIASSNTVVPDGVVHLTPFSIPQATRATSFVTASVATDNNFLGKLALSIANTTAGGCP